MFAVEIVLHIVVSALAGGLVGFLHMRTRGVRGLRVLHRDLLDLQADHNALAKRLQKIHASNAGEASAEKKRHLSKTTIDFVESQRLAGAPGEAALGQ